jgi:glyoxylase-like metal-dependent hydrolase (beta-lactamase superfamily II)
MSTFRAFVGGVQVTAVSDGDLFMEKSFYPAISEAQWGEYSDQVRADGRLLMNLGSFVLHSRGQNILVDTGLGATPGHFMADCGRLPREMRDRGVPPEDIDTVLLTHLHGDHVGWNIVGEGENRTLGFPKARYLAPKVDWEDSLAMSGSTLELAEDEAVRQRRVSAFVKQVQPLQAFGRLDLYEGEHVVTPEITTIPAPGHTPGHMCVRISSQGETAIIMGDAVHLPHEVHEMDWVCRGDRDAAATIATREKLLNDAESAGGLVLAGHFPAPGMGRLARASGRRYWHAL